MTEVKKGRGRPVGSGNKPKAPKSLNSFPDPSADNEAVEPGHNQPKVAKEPLSDDQQHKLTALHAKAYEKALAKKKESDALFKNAVKLAKAEGIPLKQIKEYISYQTEDGKAQLREDLARKQKVAIWAGMPIGTQINFLDDIDRTPIDERMFDDGKRAGIKGEKCEVPRHVPGNLVSKWTEGWSAGQEVLMGKMKQHNENQRAEDAAAFDDDLPGDEVSQIH